MVCFFPGKTSFSELRKFVEETRKGTTNMRSRMFEDILYHFNEAPNVHGRPESRRRKYVFGIVPERSKGYEDSKIQDAHPTVVPIDREGELICDKVLTRFKEKLTVLVIQGKAHIEAALCTCCCKSGCAEFWIGPGCGEVCAYRRCKPCEELATSSASLTDAAASDASL